jgi:hypothetical protein
MLWLMCGGERKCGCKRAAASGVAVASVPLLLCRGKRQAAALLQACGGNIAVASESAAACGRRRVEVLRAESLLQACSGDRAAASGGAAAKRTAARGVADASERRRVEMRRRAEMRRQEGGIDCAAASGNERAAASGGEKANVRRRLCCGERRRICKRVAATMRRRAEVWIQACGGDNAVVSGDAASVRRASCAGLRARRARRRTSGHVARGARRGGDRGRRRPPRAACLGRDRRGRAGARGANAASGGTAANALRRVEGRLRCDSD